MQAERGAEMGGTARARWAYLLPGAQQTCIQAPSRCVSVSSYVELYYFPSAGSALGRDFLQDSARVVSKPCYWGFVQPPAVPASDKHPAWTGLSEALRLDQAHMTNEHRDPTQVFALCGPYFRLCKQFKQLKEPGTRAEEASQDQRHV